MALVYMRWKQSCDSKLILILILLNQHFKYSEEESPLVSF